MQSSQKIWKNLSEIAPGKQSRFADSPALDFLEQHLFRYHRSVYEKEQQEIQIFSARDPEKEMEETARRILRLVREKDYHYGQIAVITGNLEEYGSVAGQVFEDAGIPYFIDEKHSILMNPFVEYLRAALEMVVQGFSYESVFRHRPAEFGYFPQRSRYAGELCDRTWNPGNPGVAGEMGACLSGHGSGTDGRNQ